MLFLLRCTIFGHFEQKRKDDPQKRHRQQRFFVVLKKNAPCNQSQRIVFLHKTEPCFLYILNKKSFSYCYFSTKIKVCQCARCTNDKLGLVIFNNFFLHLLFSSPFWQSLPNAHAKADASTLTAYGNAALIQHQYAPFAILQNGLLSIPSHKSRLAFFKQGERLQPNSQLLRRHKDAQLLQTHRARAATSLHANTRERRRL